MTQVSVIVLLVFYIICREVFFLYSTHKMINKIMSHNFHDYQQSVNVRPIKHEPLKLQPEDQAEDLGSLEGFGIL